MPESYAERVKRILGQEAPPATSGGGVKVLLRCDRCGKPWLQDGAKHILMLPEAIAQQLATELHADLAALPYATCDACAALHGGQMEIDEYTTREGTPFAYGFSFEGADPPGMHLLCTVMNVAQAERLGAHMPRPGIVTDFARARSVIAWLVTIPMPAEYRAISPAQAANMARMNPPGHKQKGTDNFVWAGGDWRVKCPALGGVCAVSMAQALPRGEPYSLAITVQCWRILAKRLQRGTIAGESQQ